LERLATRLLDRKPKQPDSRSPIERELEGIELWLLTRDELDELGEFLEVGKDMASGSSALPPASRERFRELIAKATPKR
jgi:hypothetical protein